MRKKIKEEVTHIRTGFIHGKRTIYNPIWGVNYSVADQEFY